ncbi:MAG: histidinol-phosphatase [Verrucomicrobia bacterium]|nr:histidinol-phosphatase [Verrucomicrobiota bacterium]MCH8527189.1 histidinol-phosphatase [Kiritimatiellia bacterium]
MAACVYETHSHTPLCKHAQGMPSDLAAVAEARGLKGLIITCHCPLPDGMSHAVRMDPSQWDEYQDMVRAAREEYAGRVDVRLGVESDWLPGLEGWLEALHAGAPLNYVLGSVHPQIQEYKDLYLSDDWPAYHIQYFSSLAEAAETGLFDCLSHPDLVKNYGTETWDVEARMPHILKCLDRIAVTGIAMELNTSGRNKTLPQMNPGPEILRAMRERDIPVVVGSDAHEPGRVADNFLEAYDLLEACGYDRVRYFIERKPVDLKIADARASLKGLG